MILFFRDKAVFVHCFHHQLGSIRRDLDQLQAEKLLVGTAETLAAIGYRYNFGVDKRETLLSLTTGPLSHVLKCAREPCGFYDHVEICR
jgi:hypothetical protein